MHVGADELGEVFVGTDDQHVQPRAAGLRRQRADHVIGLDTVDGDHRECHGIEQLANARKLAFQIVRRVAAIGLVLRIPVVAEGVAWRIEDHAETLRLVVLVEPPQHVEEAEHRAGGFAIGGR